ncbi:MAG: lipocalin-like domain-containing protein [Chloroflexota bacterium]
MHRSLSRRVAGTLLAVLLCLVNFTPAHTASGQREAYAYPLVHLPADQAAHTSADNEWWYVVGHLHSGHSLFGYEVTIFHFNHLKPPGFNTPLNLYRTDVALTDERGRRFYHEITPYFPDSAVTSSRVLNVRVGSASLVGKTPQHMLLRASLAAGNIHLSLSSRRGPLLVGGRGYLPFATGYTYYYSLTDVTTAGTLRIGGKTFQVTGISWLDHQWGNWSWATVRGWTWMCLQLHNGVQLSAFHFPGDSGQSRGANILLSNGRLVVSRDIIFSSIGIWHSRQTRGDYPAAVRLTIPSESLDVVVRPTIPNQEMVWKQVKRGSYWEGSSNVSGTYGGKPVSGVAYLELTGYAKG